MNTKFELYKRCIKGECTPEEASQVETWLKEDPAAFEAEMLEELLQVEAGRKMPAGLKEEMLLYFQKKGVPVEPASVEVPVHSKLRWIRWTVAAAAALTGIVIGARFLQKEPPAKAPIAWSKIFNNTHAVRQIVLPDSSKVWLNAFATINYPADMNALSQREVKLEGEAYFIIKGRPGQGFVVRTGSLETWVLGTEFNVEAYADEEVVKVSLQQGKVKVNYLNKEGRQSEGKILAPGQMAMYRKSGFKLAIGKTAVTEPNAWTKNEVVLNDVNLRDALQRIGRKYSQEIVFDTARAMRYQHITARYDVMPLDQILSQLGFTCDFQFKKDNHKYTISFKSTHRSLPVRK